MQTTLKAQDGTLHYRITSGSFLIGAKDFSPESAGVDGFTSVKAPTRSPDKIEEQSTSPHLAQIYRYLVLSLSLSPSLFALN
jgi:hypothetical protein